jgi:hypothetical protein
MAIGLHCHHRRCRAWLGFRVPPHAHSTRSSPPAAFLLIFAKLASLMTFRFKIRLFSAIFAHRYDCLRTTFFSRSDETLAHCANDADMSFVCAHVMFRSPVAIWIALSENITARRKCLEDFHRPTQCALPQPKFSPLLNRRRAPVLLFSELGPANLGEE